MAERTPRFLWQNYAQLSGASITATGYEGSHPPRWAQDPALSLRWKSPVGWSVARRFNDRLRFSSDAGATIREALLTPADYSTGDALAAHIEDQMAGASLYPPCLSNVKAWWRASDLLKEVGGGGTPTAWADVVSDRALTINGSPTVVVNALNGMPYLRMSSAYLVAAGAASDIMSVSGATVMILCRVRDGAGDGAVWVARGAAGATAYVKWDADPGQFLFGNDDGGGADEAEQSESDNTWVVLTFMIDGSNVSGGCQDADTAALDTQASGNNTDLSGAFHIGGNNGAEYCDLDLAEIVVCNAAMSEENRRRIAERMVTEHAIENDTTAAPTWSADTYAASYSSTTKLFTISTDAAALLLYDAERSVQADLNMDGNQSGSDSYDSDDVCYQSRQALTVDLGSAVEVRVAIVREHNLLSGASVDYHSANDWTGEETSFGSLSGDDKIQVKFVASGLSARYWRFLFDERENPDGYVEIGLVFLGDYFQPGRSFAQGYREVSQIMSNVTESQSGAAFIDERSNRFRFSGRLPRLSRTDRDAFITMMNALRGRPLFIAFDPQNYSYQETYYGRIEGEADREQRPGDGTPPDRFNINVSFVELVE